MLCLVSHPVMRGASSRASDKLHRIDISQEHRLPWPAHAHPGLLWPLPAPTNPIPTVSLGVASSALFCLWWHPWDDREHKLHRANQRRGIRQQVLSSWIWGVRGYPDTPPAPHICLATLGLWWGLLCGSLPGRPLLKRH